MRESATNGGEDERGSTAPLFAEQTAADQPASQARLARPRTASIAYAEYLKSAAREMHRGRGASGNLASRFEALHVELDPTEPQEEEERPKLATQFFRDATKTIIARNNSPDVSFETSINPYRGCEHGCAYCFARPTHEY